MAISSTPIANLGVPGSGSAVSSVTSGSINTTGADFIAVAVGSYYYNSTTAKAISVSDNKGNGNYTPLTAYGVTGSSNGSAGFIQLFYIANPSVGSGHTFTVSVSGGGTDYIAFCIAAWSGVGSSPFDKQNGNNGGNSPQACGSVSPAVAGELIIAACASGDGSGGSLSIGSSFTISNSEAWAPGYTAVGMAYYLDSGTTAENPSWTIGTSSYVVCAIATFEPTASGTNMVQRECWWNQTAYNA